MKKTLYLIALLASSTLAQAASGIYGGYFTINGTKYKATESYGGSETVFSGFDFGDFTAGSSTLVLSQAETLAFRDNSSSVFAFAYAYRVRLAADSKSTNPGNYTFLDLGNGVFIGGNNEKGEITGQSIDFINALPTGDYAIDVVHKVGANDGGGNFEWLASTASASPGVTNWGSTNAFTATFTVVPEPSSAVLLGLGALALIFRRRK
jgi:hypothetical protein